jgi:hypothetical protein
MSEKTISRYCPFKSPEVRMMIHMCLVANLILSHFLKILFDKLFLCAVVYKQKFFEIFYGYKKSNMMM